jgi:uridine phosphorylase
VRPTRQRHNGQSVRVLADDVAPILEFDTDPAALIDPYTRSPIPDPPMAAVACQFPELIEELCRDGEALMRLPSLGTLWRIDHDGEPLGVFYPGQGASLAAVSVERVLAAGCRMIVACGGAGVLVPEMELGQVVVVESALRDEGTSYHYLPPAREVQVDPDVVAVLTAVAGRAGVPFVVGKCWTTDGFFRETRGKVARRRDEGCIVVDAEAAALLAVASFRRATIGQVLYAADDVSGATRNDRQWKSADAARRSLFRLAATSAIELARTQRT